LKDSTVAAQTVLPSRESIPHALNSPTDCVLDPELTDFCSHLHITPAIGQFHNDDDDNDDSDLDHFVSNQSSEIEEL
jgi:hypothetical protein